MVCISDDPLHFQYGMEITFHATADAVNRCKDEVTAELRKFAKDRKMKMAKGDDPLLKTDSNHTAEFTSPILTTLIQIEKYYTLVRSIADKNGWPSHPRKWCTGGGHLHVSRTHRSWVPSISQDKAQEALNRQPFIAWAFNDPEDVDGIHWKSHYDSMFRRRGTLELRFFQAPRNLEEQLLHVQFADLWLRRIDKWTEMPFLDMHHRPPCRLAKQLFLETVDTLDLDTDDYKRFTRNIEIKYELGRQWRET
jgi:hypothetical protein